ncbi:putative ISXo8 transposase [Thermopolyspora flexuosa]|uniref:SRSO17 transposase n=1 Tax=Thermopolyspora flexuosa TaxID=103836 RepID=A0A543ITP6_9ACTN|nr:transposase [Thermopolyspora flexuosa]TQM73949.1 SRSO17 transposase [Thermopolyspora flexuosa]GGM93448.1 putative ISXo8 transposase [Thermopolyspora flexuosa]
MSVSLGRTPGTTAQVDVHAVDGLADEVFASLPRADQRRWARVYLRGLLLTQGKKSMRRLAEAAVGSASAWHSLQQFVNASTWSWDAPRSALASWVERRASVRAWTVPQIVLPKRGDRLVGVHQRFDPRTGRTVNCQAITALLLSCPGANFPVDWHMHLPPEWVSDERARQEARIPPTATSEPGWRLALDLVRRAVRRAGEPGVPVVADLSDADDPSAAVAELEALGLDFVAEIDPRVQVIADESPLAHHRSGRSRNGAAISAARSLEANRRWNTQTATIMGCDGGFRHTRILWAPVRLPAVLQGSYRLFAVADEGVAGQGPIWLTNLTERRWEELLELVVLQASARVTVDCMNERFHYLGFSGRSYPGWHHHMTLVSAAYAYSRLGGPALAVGASVYRTA